MSENTSPVVVSWSRPWSPRLRSRCWARWRLPPAPQRCPSSPLTNAQAKALGYVEDATKTTNKAFKPGSNCANCQFFTAATGACTLFAGFSVAPKGWCTAWAKKAA